MKNVYSAQTQLHSRQAKEWKYKKTDTSELKINLLEINEKDSFIKNSIWFVLLGKEITKDSIMIIEHTSYLKKNLSVDQ